MKIALVAQHCGAHPGAAGPEPSALDLGLFDLAAALGRHGHRVTIYTRRDSAGQPATRTLESGVTVRYLPAGPADRRPGDKPERHVRQFAERLADSWRRDRPDVAHAYFWTGGLAALAVARELHVPVVQTFFSLGAAEQRHRLPDTGPAGRVRLEASIAAAVDGVLAGSSEETAELAGLGVPPSAVRMVPCGVDITRFAPDGQAASRGRRPRLIAFGPLIERQGLDTVIRALAQVPDAELVIIGGPPRRLLREDHQYRTLAGLAGSAGARTRVIFTGQIAAADLPAWLRSADLLVSGAQHEPSGMAAVQAMACGVPVVASAVGTNLDTVIDGTTGALVPPGRPKLLARRIRELLAAPIRRGALAAAAADHARSRYSWDRISQETLAAYQATAQVPAS